MNRFLLFCLLSFPLSLWGQTTAELVSFFNFDNNSFQDAVNIQNLVLPQGNLGFGCGLGIDALQFPDGNSYGVIQGPVNDRFGTGDFTLAFYFHVGADRSPQLLFSKRDSLCSDDNAMTIRYIPLEQRVEVALRENNSKNLLFSADLPADKCWYHLTLVRRANRVRLYINGQFVEEQTNTTRLNLTNNGLIHLGYSFCPQVGENPFQGRIDEMRVYIRNLNDSEVAGLYEGPDRILNANNRIFLGQSVDVQLGPTCGNAFTWNPTLGVDPPLASEPTITPVFDGTQQYAISIREGGEACIASDTITIVVVNPDSLDCNQILLPGAFTPNGSGPAENETFGISNPFAVDQLISLEIFDLAGGRIFATANPFERWDGTLNGRPMNSQNVVYLLRWRCDGEEKSQRGAVSIIR